MRKIEAIIHTWALDSVHSALAACGVEGFTVSEVSAFRDGGDRRMSYRGASYVPECSPVLRMEIIVRDEDAHAVAEAIGHSATGECLLTVQPVRAAVRIRTGERGVGAIGTCPSPVRRVVSRPGGAAHLHIAPSRPR